MSLFLCGLLVSAIALAGSNKDLSDRRAAEIRRLRILNRTVTTPALIAVWGLGITLALKGGWFAAPWLHAKIALVVCLSGVHGLQSAAFRRLHNGTAVRARSFWWPIIVSALAATVILLAAAKPGF